MWPLDGRCSSSTEDCFEASWPRYGESNGASMGTADWTQIFSGTTLGETQEGILQNNAAQFFRSGTFTTDITTGSLFPIYSRRYLEYNDKNRVYFLAGDAKWEAGDQAGVDPFYDSYDDYVEDIMRMGKDHGILPEFRMSEHMYYYLNTKGGDFLAENTASLTLTGAIYANEGEDGFVVNYKHSDFLKAFKVVNEDFGEKIPATTLELECNAILKFLPYDGFYPAQRTVQLAKMFFEDYADVIWFSSSRAGSTGPPSMGTGGRENTILTPGYSIGARPINQALFAPGILFNSIKSGLAVDYAIMTSSFEISGSSASDQYENGYIKNIPRIAAITDNTAGTGPPFKVFGHRVPFEALAGPEDVLTSIYIVDHECHPSAQLNMTASILGPGKSTYRFAMNNFLATTVDFFRPDGRMATIASLPDNDANFGVFKEGVPYGMEVWLTNGIARTYDALVARHIVLRGGPLDHYTYTINPPSVVMYERSGSIDTWGSSFGPPVDAGVQYEGAYNTPIAENLILHTSATYSAHTPPYYDSISWARIHFVPPRTDKFTLDEIIPLLKTENFGADKMISKISSWDQYDDIMPVSSSINIMQLSKQYGVKFGPNGIATEVDKSIQYNQWVIQPKWECPVLDFSNANITLPTLGSGSVPRGMWHQYGQIPSSEKGIMLQIQDISSDENASTDSTFNLTASLADALGFKKDPIKIGEIAQQKEIFEAIIAIPHFMVDPTNEKGNKVRFKIPKETINIAEMILNEGGLSEKTENYIKSIGAVRKPTKDIVNMVEKMKKYVIPPQLDFVTNKTVDPFAMFIFEFSAMLSQQDLANIWQNLPPQIGSSAQKSKATLPINIFKSNEEDGKSMLEMIPNNIQWSIFKVKQRASYNYFTKTADSKDDTRFKFNFEVGSKSAEKQSEPDYSFN